MKPRLLALVLVLLFGVLVAPVLAQTFPGEGSTCTTDPTDGSGLRECGTPDDNECNPGGVLYRDENQDGCTSEWHWKAGWFLARFNDGLISRANFPVEFVSVLPSLPSKEEAAAAASTCMIDMTSEGYSIVSVPATVLNRDPGTFNTYTDGTYTWRWHNGGIGEDLGFDYDNEDWHVYTLGSGWDYPTTGDCTVNEANMPAP